MTKFTGSKIRDVSTSYTRHNWGCDDTVTRGKIRDVMAQLQDAKLGM